ncbi:MAG TPA: glycosyltransferase [Bryobacteraceae bacterium]|nr:glycosyltransferase [Bryobacteraceae bacterium]
MELVESIRHLKPARVLDADGTVAARLRTGSLVVDTDETAVGRYDLVVWMNPDGQAGAVRRWATITDAVLFAAPEADLPRWLEAFLDAGFVPDLSYRGPAVLLRRGTTLKKDVAALLAELLRLQAREEQAAALEHRIEFLHAIADDLARQTTSVVESRTWRILTGTGGLFLRRIRRKLTSQAFESVPAPGRYHRWIADYEKREVSADSGGPLVSVVAPDERTLASLRAQTYKKWEAVPSAAAGTGAYLLYPGPGDELSPDALARFAAAAESGAGLVYCDEDELDEHGVRMAPLFKPDWSPDLLLSQDYIGRAMIFRRDLARESAGTYEIALRAGDAGERIEHLAEVLYHRRGPREPAPREAIEQSLPGVSVEVGRAPGCWRVRYPIPPNLAVDIIVPSRDAALLDRCLNSVRANTGYTAYGITVIDNSKKGLEAVAVRHGARHLDWRKRPFNYSAMNNEAALGGTAPLLLFLNDDTTVIDPGWLEAMVELAVRPAVGVVGARLLYPGGTIQHAGVVIGIFGVCGHAFKGWPGDAPTYGNYGGVIRNVSAVTGACLMTRAEVFREAEGFDAGNFPVAYNDIDLCLRIQRRGRRVLYTPHASLYHHEALSKPWRLRRPSRAEVRAFQARWREYIADDPYYSPNLTRAAENYALRSRSCED